MNIHLDGEPMVVKKKLRLKLCGSFAGYDTDNRTKAKTTHRAGKTSQDQTKIPSQKPQ